MVGELYIGGKQVTKGYQNKPLLTERFLPSNLKKANEIIYKTGDMACWLSDGNLYFLGRNDNQMKIQGYRIEISEIESAIIKFPGINQAVVTLQDGKYKDKYLRCYITCDILLKSDIEIKHFLSTKLPKYMIPREFCLADSIPLKENEKIDYTALSKQKFRILSPAETVEVDSKQNVERNIQQIWKNILIRLLLTLKMIFSRSEAIHYWLYEL